MKQENIPDRHFYVIFQKANEIQKYYQRTHVVNM